MFPPFCKQAWTMSGVLLNMLAQGMVLSYPSCLLPTLRAPDSPMRADLETASWIASSVGLAGIPGFLLSSMLMDRCGRRFAHGIALLPGVAGWTLIFFATTIPALLIGRILTGMTSGATVGLGAVVIGEYTSPKHRGMFLNLKTAAVCIGSMIVHVLANSFTWRSIALLALIPYILSFIIITTWPESPAWLASKKRFEDCENSFLWLRGKSESSIKELEEMIKSQMEQFKSVDIHTSIGSKTVKFFKKFTRKDFLKPLSIILLGLILVEVCGRHLFPAYAVDIISEVTGSRSSSFYYTLALDMIITVSATFSSILIKFMKRRTLLFGTGLAALLVLAAVCSYLYLASIGIISKDRPWIPISLFVVYFILASLGCTPIPLAFIGEVLPLEHRGAGSSVAGLMLSLCVNAGLQATPFLLVNMKVQGTFTVFGVLMGVVMFILYLILPETKDRTLQEIEYYFNHGRYKEDDQVTEDDEEVKVKMIKSGDGKVKS